MIDNKYDDYYSKIYIIDSRFPYEYSKGHIKTAINLCDPKQIEPNFFNDEMINKGKILLIFYCEFSILRSVEMYFLNIL